MPRPRDRDGHLARSTIGMDGGMLPGVLYESGLAPVRAMLAAAERGERRAR